MIIIIESQTDLELYRRDIIPEDVKCYNILDYSEYSKRYVRHEIDCICLDCFYEDIDNLVEV